MGKSTLLPVLDGRLTGGEIICLGLFPGQSKKMTCSFASLERHCQVLKSLSAVAALCLLMLEAALRTAVRFRGAEYHIFELRTVIYVQSIHIQETASKHY